VNRRLLAFPAALVAATTVALPIAEAHAQRAAATVRVTASEFKFGLSARAVRKGVVVFKVKNGGKLAHDFKIGGKKTALLDPGKSTTMRVVFKRAGKYHYLCTVAGHATLGMRGTLTVR
jgi:uncharacterized cupredoxin-like copper-binding protein